MQPCLCYNMLPGHGTGSCCYSDSCMHALSFVCTEVSAPEKSFSQIVQPLEILIGEYWSGAGPLLPVGQANT